MGTDDPATEQRRPRVPDDRPEPRLVGVRRAVAAVRRATDSLRTRTVAILTTFVEAVRAAIRYYLRGGARDDRTQPLATHRGTLGRSLDTTEQPGGNGGRSRPQLAEAAGRTRQRQLPGPAGQRRRLPAGDDRLRVERTPERLTLSDPDEDEAYLSSTVWVDVEE